MCLCDAVTGRYATLCENQAVRLRTMTIWCHQIRYSCLYVGLISERKPSPLEFHSVLARGEKCFFLFKVFRVATPRSKIYGIRECLTLSDKLYSKNTSLDALIGENL